MFAIIETGGKQYKVSKNTVFRTERLKGTPGAAVVFDKVLMIGDDGALKIGTPYVEGARVLADIHAAGRAPTLTVFHKRRRKNSRRTIGHRQHWTELAVTQILQPGEEAAPQETAPQKAASSSKAVPAQDLTEPGTAKQTKEKTPANKTTAKKADTKKAEAASKKKETQAAQGKAQQSKAQQGTAQKDKAQQGTDPASDTKAASKAGAEKAAKPRSPGRSRQTARKQAPDTKS